MSRHQSPDQHMRDLIANWPPFTPEQRDKLRILLKPAGDQR